LEVLIISEYSYNGNMEIIISTPNLEIYINDGLVVINYIIEQIVEVTAKLKI